ADRHDSRGPPRQGVPDERSGLAGVPHDRAVHRRHVAGGGAGRRSAMKRTLWIVLIGVSVATSADAQFAVIDPANLAQTVLIAERTAREYAPLVEQYQTIVRMARGLGSLDQYRIPTIGLRGHDVSQWPFA